MARVLSGIQPTGVPHLGNWIGAISRWAAEQQPGHFFCIVDLHAITLPIEPAVLRANTLELAAWLLAAGIDPDVATLFVQSHVPEHTELSWILECTATMGELGRMTQFKDKSRGRESVALGLFTYPVLQAADILVYDADEVPVGDDQRQHVEVTRDIAQRFNARYGDVLRLPKATFPPAGARVMDLQDVGAKMSKSASTMAGVVLLSESEDATRKKILRAVTDSGTEVRADPDKPGVTNLLDLLSAVTGTPVPALEASFDGQGYGAFKAAVADAVNDYLRPARERQAALVADPGAVTALLRKGAERAQSVAAGTVDRVREAVGFLPA